MSKNKNKSKAKKETVEEKQVDAVQTVEAEQEQIEIDPVAAGVSLYDAYDQGTPIKSQDPILSAAILIGITDTDKYFTRVSRDEFKFLGYGICLKFMRDGDRWKVIVDANMTRGKCNQTAYWLSDKLQADTDEKLFYTPGREGIRR